MALKAVMTMHCDHAALHSTTWNTIVHISSFGNVHDMSLIDKSCESSNDRGEAPSMSVYTYMTLYIHDCTSVIHLSS